MQVTARSGLVAALREGDELMNEAADEIERLMALWAAIPCTFHLFAAAERTHYESEAERLAAQERVEGIALEAFPNSKSGYEALQRFARHQDARLRAARSRVDDALGRQPCK